jgi:hypothetical protein
LHLLPSWKRMHFPQIVPSLPQVSNKPSPYQWNHSECSHKKYHYRQVLLHVIPSTVLNFCVWAFFLSNTCIWVTLGLPP